MHRIVRYRTVILSFCVIVRFLKLLRSGIVILQFLHNATVISKQLRNYHIKKPSCVWSDDPWCEDEIEYESFGKFDL